MKPNFRVGFGFDVHQLKDGIPFWLGGIQIPHEKGILGHSDADVLIHALCDAILGACGDRDIGHHFPNTDAALKGIDSKELLKRVIKLLGEKKYAVGNADITVCAERPKINPHLNKMKETLAPLMNVSIEDIAIKATTNETMGFIGREEGIVAYATVLIYRID
jgi:2-C-methyl-D-erythritol 2,4-cyclodiphosphate synthase